MNATLIQLKKERLFIAIELSEDSKQFLSTIQDQLKSSSCDVKWVKASNFHVTLKFLGDVSVSKMSSIKRCLESICYQMAPFVMTYQSLGVFPNIRRPRVVWVGLDDENNQIQDLVHKINQEMKELRFSEDKQKFQPHVTLGRIKSLHNTNALLKKILSMSVNSLRQQKVTHVALIKSQRTPQGSIYSIIGRAEFLGAS